MSTAIPPLPHTSSLHSSVQWQFAIASTKHEDYCALHTCSALKLRRRFGGRYRSHLQDGINRARYQREGFRLGIYFHAGILLDLFNPEGWVDIFFRNVD
jgi:hypothetical protein